MDFQIYEVTPRDGLQGLDTIIPTADKITLIDMIVNAGIKRIEVGAFVHPQLVPNMADSELVLKRAMQKHPDCELAILIPNKKGMEKAKKRGVERFNIFMSPSEGFTISNHNDTRANVFSKYCEIMKDIPKRDVRVYLSCVFGCPIDGEIEEDKLVESLRWAETFGDTIVLSDTAGQATGEHIEDVVRLIRKAEITSNIALHLHHGENDVPMTEKLDSAFFMGVREFDSCIMGLGGCPFVDGSGGNLSTEELVYWGLKNGLDCGIYPENLLAIEDFVVRKLKEQLTLTV